MVFEKQFLCLSIICDQPYASYCNFNGSMQSEVEAEAEGMS